MHFVLVLSVSIRGMTVFVLFFSVCTPGKGGDSSLLNSTLSPSRSYDSQLNTLQEELKKEKSLSATKK